MCGILFLCYNLTYSGPYNATKLGIATSHLILYVHCGNQQIYFTVLPRSHTNSNTDNHMISS